jgi:deazaflavin-dependent oxidoreductase (nitroreductase family)
MANWEWFTKLHRGVYRRSGGRLMARLAGIDMLLLTTRGRRSGQPRTTPLACFRDGEHLVVVASNNGQAHDPAWWKNLEERPEAEVQLGAERFAVRARRARGPERERLWPWLVQQNRAYARYARKTSREIPVVVLERVEATRA